ncbi:MAG TPA: tripartite tricarboxylate transporter substrate binding protein [Burkholderiales bacterium]|nr:tripartite tricarboxylate transporter substrate binding protein [Burkholderiales bacterium]
MSQLRRNMHTRRIPPVAAAFLFSFFATFALAQSAYPNRAIRLIVDTSPGGITDILGRLSAEGLAQKLGQPVVVENKPGASGNVAIDFVVRSPADGHTLMICAGGNLVVKPFLEHALSFDPMNDLAPVFNVAEAPHILVVPASLPAATVAEFIVYARANPGKVYYGSAGVGSPPHLSLELFARHAGVKLVHVPYKGVGNALPDMISGRVQVMSISYGSARPYLRSGQIRPLAAGARHRLAGLPEVPTSAEAGVPGWEMSAWFGIFAPKETPPAILRLLNERMQEVIDDPKARQRLFEIGAEPVGGSVDSFSERFRSDYRMWGQVIKESGIKLE